MTIHDSTTDNRILQSLPDDIHAAVLTYASESALTPAAVIEGAIQHFLELDTSLSTKLSSTVEETSLLAVLPLIIQSQAKQYAEKIEVPAEFVIELAISHFLNPDSVTFDDCQIKVDQGSIAWLKQYADSASVAAA